MYRDRFAIFCVSFDNARLVLNGQTFSGFYQQTTIFNKIQNVSQTLKDNAQKLGSQSVPNVLG